MNIYGASGHGKVILDILKSNSEKIDNIFDDDPGVTEFFNYKVIHKPGGNVLKIPSVLAIGDNIIRKRLAHTFTGVVAKAIKHSSAVISENVKMAEGTVIMPSVVINSDTEIGKHCIVNSGAVVEHDVKLEDFVHISPNAVITGNVTIGEGTQVGAGASVIPGIKIGKWVTIGAGTVVIENVPDFAVVVGNPGKIIKFSNE